MEIKGEILEKSFRFAVAIVEAYKVVVRKSRDKVLSKKLLRSGTQLGNQLQMSVDAESDKEVYDRLRIAYRFSREAKYWIKLMVESDFLELETGQNLFNDVTEISLLIKDELDVLKDIRQNLNSVDDAD